MKEQKFSYQDCQGELMECTQVQFSYPVFSSDELAGINALIFSTLSDPQLRLNVKDDVSEEALQDSALGFISNFDAFITEMEESAQKWFWVGDVEFSQHFDDFFTLKFTLELYSGGAHQITKETFVNVMNEGKLIVLEDLFKEESRSKIAKSIEKAFRIQSELSPEQNLTEVGLFKNKIPYTNNAMLNEEGILFHYDPYEIAPWTTGPIEILVSYSEINEEIVPTWLEKLSAGSHLQ